MYCKHFGFIRFVSKQFDWLQKHWGFYLWFLSIKLFICDLLFTITAHMRNVYNFFSVHQLSGFLMSVTLASYYAYVNVCQVNMTCNLENECVANH